MNVFTSKGSYLARARLFLHILSHLHLILNKTHDTDFAAKQFYLRILHIEV